MNILVLSLHDDIAGPMAAAFLSDYSTDVKAVSVGLWPAEHINGLAVAVMKECLIDLSGQSPTPYAKTLYDDVDAILAVSGDVEDFPIKGKPCVQWHLDETGETLEDFRILRDRVKDESFRFFRDFVRK